MDEDLSTSFGEKARIACALQYSGLEFNEDDILSVRGSSFAYHVSACVFFGRFEQVRALSPAVGANVCRACPFHSSFEERLVWLRIGWLVGGVAALLLDLVGR